MWDMMLGRGHKPDVATYSALIHGYFLINEVNGSTKLFYNMIQIGLTSDVKSYSIMINGYCKNKKVDQALTLFKEMRHKN